MGNFSREDGNETAMDRLRASPSLMRCAEVQLEAPLHRGWQEFFGIDRGDILWRLGVHELSQDVNGFAQAFGRNRAESALLEQWTLHAEIYHLYQAIGLADLVDQLVIASEQRDCSLGIGKRILHRRYHRLDKSTHDSRLLFNHFLSGKDARTKKVGHIFAVRNDRQIVMRNTQ